jgi:hypothetical protein
VTPDRDRLDAIRADPTDEPRWLVLATWFAAAGRHDEAASIRVFWPALRDSLTAGRSLESELDDVRRHAALFGRLARAVEERAAAHG